MSIREPRPTSGVAYTDIGMLRRIRQIGICFGHQSEIQPYTLLGGSDRIPQSSPVRLVRNAVRTRKDGRSARPSLL